MRAVLVAIAIVGACDRSTAPTDFRPRSCGAN